MAGVMRGPPPLDPEGRNPLAPPASCRRGAVVAVVGEGRPLALPAPSFRRGAVAVVAARRTLPPLDRASVSPLCAPCWRAAAKGRWFRSRLRAAGFGAGAGARTRPPPAAMVEGPRGPWSHSRLSALPYRSQPLAATRWGAEPLDSVRG